MKPQKNKKRNVLLRVFDLRYIFYDFVKITGILPIILYLRLKFYYENGQRQKGLFRGPSIIVSNHTGTFDIIVLLAILWNRRISFIAKKDLFKKKIGKLFFNGVRAISLDSENVSIDVIKKAQNVIESGHLVGIFPEGHINTKKKIDDFKAGAVLLSILTDAPIIQVYIEKREKWWKRQRVVISDKIYLKNYISFEYPTVNEMEKISKMLYQKEVELCDIIKNDGGKNNE